MRYWWVNQNKTYRHEVAGGYLWSPKLNKGGRANPFYEFMREVAPGDVIFSFCDTAIKAIGVATLHAYEAPKPPEFGKAGMDWESIGWRVDVRFTELRGPMRPVHHIERLRPYLPTKYSPLTPQGKGQQNLYLTALSDLLAYQLIDLIGSEARAIVQAWSASEQLAETALTGQILWEEHQVEQLKANTAIAETEREAIVLARRGQGLFRSRVSMIERSCRLTGVTNTDHLRASHTKPWRDANNQERVDGENGLLLTPDADHLFDRGFISFDYNGTCWCRLLPTFPLWQRWG